MATPIQPPTNPSELQLFRVLQRANLLQYFDTFISQGGDDVQQLCEAGEDEFLEIMALVGMASKPLHVRRLQKALQAWVVNPSAFEGNVRKIFPTHVHSMTGSTSQGMGHTSSGDISPAHATTMTTERPIGSSGSGQQQDFKMTPPQSSTISTSTPWSSALYANQGQASPSENSSREQPSPADSQEDEFKDMLFNSESGQAYSGGSGAVSLTSLGQPMLLEHQITAIATAAALLAQELPPIEPKSLPKKQISKEINVVMTMSSEDPMKMDALRKYAAIYGRFDSKRKNDRPMSLHEISVNEAAAQLCSHLPALLTRREELFPLARQVVRDSGYQYSKGHSRAAEIIPTKTEPPGDLSPETTLTSPSPPSNVPASSPLEEKLTKTQNDLTDVTSNLSELAKEQDRIRTALRVLLEAKDHTQMSALTAEMDTINDRYARLTTRRQELVIQLAMLRRPPEKVSLSGASMSGSSGNNNSQTCGTLKADDFSLSSNNKHNNNNNRNNTTAEDCSNNNNSNTLASSGNSLNTLLLASALQNNSNNNEGSLIEEGLRIATQYGMSDFAQELLGMKNLQPLPDNNTDDLDLVAGAKRRGAGKYKSNIEKSVEQHQHSNLNGKHKNNNNDNNGDNIKNNNNNNLSDAAGESSNTTPFASSSNSSQTRNNVMSLSSTSSSSTSLSSPSKSPSKSSSSSSSLTSSRLPHPISNAATTTTTINIVSGIGFQQYVSSPTTTTQKLRPLDDPGKFSNISQGSTPTTSKVVCNNNNNNNTTTQSPNHSPKTITGSGILTSSSSSSSSLLAPSASPNNNNNNKADDFITLSIPTTSPSSYFSSNDDSPSSKHSTPNTTISAIPSPPSKPVEVETMRRSSRKRTTDPDYYLINGGEKRFRSNSSRRSGSTSSERNA